MAFTDSPIINSPFDRPKWHFELDGDGQPTGKKLPDRRESKYVVPVPAARRRGLQHEMALGDVTENVLVNEIRKHVDQWRELPPGQWGVTPETQRLLLHWRDGDRERKLFFCQREAVETLIWLTEVAPKKFKDDIESANLEANPGLYRLACKMATGAGKTTVMAMIIAWHAVNRARRPGSRHFSDAFLIVTPGITIKDRLRVLKPQDAQNIYQQLDLVPRDLMDAVLKARIVITNYHSFMLRDTQQVSKLNRQILGGREGEKRFTETTGEMVARVCREGGADLMGRRNIIVLNDEAHHCYRRKAAGEEEASEAAPLTADERAEAEENSKAAHVWISGLEAFKNQLGLEAVYDLSATPFFLSGSGYGEGKLFPWVVSDFGLMDAIESGIVKVPRLPVVDDAIKGDLPKFRDVYNVIREENPRAFPMRGRRTGGVAADPSRLPHHLLEAALKDALYKHYAEVFAKWEAQPRLGRPPVFIVVCNNTATSKLIYDWISGYELTEGEGDKKTTRIVEGKLPLFSNVENGRWRSRFRSFLIDSSQIESGESLSDDFRKVAAREIDEFKKEKQTRGESVDNLTDAELLREVMNTIGRPGRLGADIRCVVSVSMLTEGWDANTVTHIMGVRAFGTELLCEQVVGRGLRRVSYEVDPKTGFFPVEYAEVLGVPFSFARGGSSEPPPPPPPVTRVRALEDRRKQFEIRFPNVEGYRILFPRRPLQPVFTKDSGMELTPDDVPNVTQSEPLIGEGITFDLRKDAENLRIKSVVFDVAGLLLREKFPDQVWRYPELVRITERWFDECLTTLGKTPKQYLKWRPLAQRAVDRIYRALVGSLIDPADGSRGRLLPIINPLNPEGSTRHVDFVTSKQTLIPTTLSHVNYVVYDKDWEAGFTERLEKLGDIVVSYVKNHSLLFEVPYEYGGDTFRYRPDFIVRLGRTDTEPLNLVVEVKGQRDVKDAAKADTMKKVWVPAVNNAGQYGRWGYLELTEIPYDIEDRLRAYLEELLAAGEDASSIIPGTPKEAVEGRIKPNRDGKSGPVITDFAQVVYENLKTAGVQNTKKGEKLILENLRPFASKTGLIAFQGEYKEKGASKRAAVSIGPEYDTVGYDLVRRAAREAVDMFDMLIVCGFAFAPEVDDTRLNFGNLTVLKARMNQDLRMADKLKATGAGNLFVVFGEPDIVIHKLKDDMLKVEIKGMDIFDPTTGEVRSSGGKDLMNDIAAWFIDNDYDEESFFVRQAYFVGDDPYDGLKRALKAEIDETAWAELNATISRPFPRPEHGRICVKVINHFGDEVQKVFQV